MLYISMLLIRQAFRRNLKHYFDGKPFSKEEMEFFNEEYNKLTGEYVDFNQDFKQYIHLLEDIIKINRIVNY